MEDHALSRVAPVLRAHFKKNRFSVAAFRPQAVRQAGNFSLLRLQAGPDLEARIAASAEKPDLVELEGFGSFAIGRCKAEAEAILDAALEGKAYAAPDPRHFEEGRMQGRVIFITGAAAAAYCDVTDEGSVAQAFEEAARVYGGVDAAVSNAGVAFSGSLETMDAKRFDFLMSVNVKGYYLVSKYAARQMRLATKYDPTGAYRDIVQINSISGLGGYVNNFTYGASKFAGIGMTQCLALELVKDRIKVNAVCPGNFYDGPLWSDPEKGLFKLYFEDGKMPGCKNVQEAEQWYRSRDPFGRGCVPEDVACSVLYCIEQQYDSGQAVGASGALRMVK